MLGRCMLRLQQYERLIKAIMAGHEISAPVQEVEAARAKRAEVAGRKTLGTLVGELVGSFLVAGEPDDIPDTPDDPSDRRATVSIRFKLSLSAEDYAQTETELRELVQLRNTLVHHFIDLHDLWSVEGCRRAQEVLDADYMRIDQHYQRLWSWAEDMDRALRDVAEYARSDEFRELVVSGTVPAGLEGRVGGSTTPPPHPPRDRSGRRGSARTR